MNEIKDGTMKAINVKNPDMDDYIEMKRLKFLEKYRPTTWVKSLIDGATGCLGHGGASTFPDRPFLNWRCEFERPRPGNGRIANRNNPETFIEGCEQLHTLLSRFAGSRYASNDGLEFSAIKDSVDNVLRFEGRKADRIAKWKESGLFTEAEDYTPMTWENQKNDFPKLNSSSEGIDSNAYRFHQAAAFHRYYVLKGLLPQHGIAIY